MSVSGGPKAGRKAVFHLMPQNREFAPSMGALEIAVDGTPVICNINMGVYGLNSALTNTMCFEDGGAVTNGQYLNGAVPPECGGVIRRCLIGDRFIYAHIVITYALDPELQVQHADRVFVLDRKTGAIVLSDAFKGERPIRFATHLHCSGSVTELGGRQYRLTGGQANLIAGIKGGSKGLDDAERGEIFVQILESSDSSRVVVEEPRWVPGYIYGLNNTGKEDIGEGRFPRYRRWRLEVADPAAQGGFLLALSPSAGEIVYTDGVVHLPQGGRLRFGDPAVAALGLECECECLLWDEDARQIIAIGLLRLRHGSSEISFPLPVDATYNVDDGTGALYAQGTLDPENALGFQLAPWTPIGEESWRTLNTCRSSFKKVAVNQTNMEAGYERRKVN